MCVEVFFYWLGKSILMQDMSLHQTFEAFLYATGLTNEALTENLRT